MTGTDKTRRPNFSDGEKEALVASVKSRISILNDKHGAKVTTATKKQSLGRGSAEC